MSDDRQGLRDDPVSPEPVHAESEPERAARPWKRIALLVGGGIITAAAAVVATLAATHKSAVRENFNAYANGLADGFADGFADGCDSMTADDDYGEYGESFSMPKMADATTWSKVVPDDETGSIIDLNYTCPHCDFPTGALVFIGPGKDLDHGWEIDQVCGVCDKQVTVMVRVAAA